MFIDFEFSKLSKFKLFNLIRFNDVSFEHKKCYENDDKRS